MNFQQTIALGGLSILAASALVAAPAQAINLKPGDILQIENFSDPGANFSITQIDFGNNGISTPGTFRVVGGGASTGGFGDLVNTLGRIKDIDLPNPTAPQRTSFLQFLRGVGDADDIFFDLDPITLSSTFTNIAGPFTVYSEGVFKGAFRNSTGTKIATGALTVLLPDAAAQGLKNGTGTANSAYLLNLEVIPTPAMLPGLIGMGLAALRKRKAEAANAEVQVEA